jgi:hypothetical protein
MEGRCQLCERENCDLNEHHLIPVHKGGRKLETIMICLDCHKQIHATFNNNELRDSLNNIEKLKNNKEMIEFFKFISKRPYGKHLKMKQSKRK